MSKFSLGIKTLISLVLFFVLSLTNSQNSFAQNSKTECKSPNYSALVIDEKSGNVLLENNSDQIIYPASLTKLMTLYLTFEAIENGRLEMEQIMIASSRAEETSKINRVNTLKLKRGDKIKVQQAIEGLIVKSFNEFSTMLAEEIAGDEWQFARKMNFKAKELNMNFTNFRNSTGLDDVGQFTNGNDLSKLVLALKRDFLKYHHFFSLKEFTYGDQEYITQNNILLNYEGADGMKTGFTNQAGYNLITTASRGGYSIISIITGCETVEKRDNLTIKLLDQAFDKVKSR